MTDLKIILLLLIGAAFGFMLARIYQPSVKHPAIKDEDVQ